VYACHLQDVAINFMERWTKQAGNLLFTLHSFLTGVGRDGFNSFVGFE
jgi:hypothetical protein